MKPSLAKPSLAKPSIVQKINNNNNNKVLLLTFLSTYFCFSGSHYNKLHDILGINSNSLFGQRLSPIQHKDQCPTKLFARTLAVYQVPVVLESEPANSEYLGGNLATAADSATLNLTRVLLRYFALQSNRCASLTPSSSICFTYKLH